MLKNAYKQLSQVDRLKTDILSNVSHELKTPITVIRGSLDIMQDSKDLEEIKTLSKIASQKLNHQLEIIENLLCFAPMNGSDEKNIFERFGLKELMDEIIEELKPYWEKKKVDVKNNVTKGIFLFAERQRIKRAIKNVVDNAIKFNKEEGKVSIKAQKDKQLITIQVDDTGVGIPTYHLQNIFQPLFQIDPTSTREYGGTGMGLCAARNCVELHGGSIWAESLNGDGTRFTIQIPAQ